MLNRFNESKITEYIYCIVITFITIIGWYFKSKWGYMCILPVTLLTVVLFNDFKYMAISTLGMIFSVGEGLSQYDFSFPMQYAVSLGIFALISLVYIIRNGINIKSIKSCKGILGLTLMAPIPLLWNNIVEDTILYFVYLSYFTYLMIYLLFVTTLKSDSFRMIKRSMIFMALIVAIEYVLIVKDNGFVKGYHLGWAVSIDAGIVMLFGLPFVFMNLIKETKWYKMLIEFCVIVLIAFGILATESRGSYIFASIEIAVLLTISFIKSPRRIIFLIEMLVLLCIALLVLEYSYGLMKIREMIINEAFMLDMNDNHRFEIWQYGVDSFNKNWISVLFGLGAVAVPDIYGFGIVYMHSSAVEVLVKFGVLGCVLMSLHFFEKFKQLSKFDFTLGSVMFFGYLFLDLYGMIDNTYGCYYYMIPLMILMASIDTMEIKDELAFSNC